MTVTALSGGISLLGAATGIAPYPLRWSNPPTIDRTMAKERASQKEKVKLKPKAETPQPQDHPITYKKVNKGGKCDCVKGLQSDLQRAYVRESKVKLLAKTDFISHWDNPTERKKHNYTDCKDICNQKGLSIQRVCIDNPNFYRIKNRHDRYPHFRPFMHIVKFGPRAGAIKSGPRHDPFHCNLYISDELNTDKPYGANYIIAVSVESLDDIDVVKKIQSHV